MYNVHACIRSNLRYCSIRCITSLRRQLTNVTCAMTYLPSCTSGARLYHVIRCTHTRTHTPVQAHRYYRLPARINTCRRGGGGDGGGGKLAHRNQYVCVRACVCRHTYTCIHACVSCF